MHFIRRSIRKEYFLKLSLSAFLVLGGCAWGYVFFKKRNVLLVFGLVALLIGLKLLRETLSHSQIESAPLWQILHRESGRLQVVWVYHVKTQVMPYGFHIWERGTIYFKLIDGREITLDLPATKQKMVSKFLNRVLPHASFGYSEERQQLFDRDPSLLLRSDQML